MCVDFICPSISWLARLPIVTATFINGASSGAICGALTAYLLNRPWSTARTSSAMSLAMLACASIVEAPRWGVTIIFSSVNRGLSVMGSFSKTSKAAPAIFPVLTALTIAASSTSPPRAQLIIRAVVSNFPNSLLPMKFLVVAVRGTWRLIKSAS